MKSINDSLSPVEQAKKVLREAGYYVDNFWQIQDVIDLFEEVPPEQAYYILNSVMQHEYLVAFIFDQIISTGLYEGLTLKGA